MPWYRNKIASKQVVQADQQNESGIIYHKGRPVPVEIGDYIVTEKDGSTYLYPGQLFEEGFSLEK